MCDINIENFNDKFKEIKETLEAAKLISIDLEFSALYPLKSQAPSLFDSPSERYQKLRKNIEQVVPLQIGLTAFNFDADSDSYNAAFYNFHILPASFPTIDKAFYFQSNTLKFLKLHEFNFNEFVYLGIPYLNKTQETELRQRLKGGSISDVQCNFKSVLEQIIENVCDKINKWYSEAPDGDKLCLPDIYKKYKHDYEIIYFLHRNIRCTYRNVWTTIENDNFLLKKVPSGQCSVLEKKYDIEEELINNLLGFAKLFRLLTSLKKPLIGHNLLQDLFLMIESFECSLPLQYSQFKNLVHTLFPTIFDTKTILYEMKRLIPEEKQFSDKGLESTFEYFKNGLGRHLALNSPAIELANGHSYGKFHQAGWDSFCTGYVFIRLAYLNIYHKYPKTKRFVSSELIAGLAHFKNMVNVIRGSVSCIKLDGEDPDSTRPPYLVVESTKNGPLDISKLSSILSSFGFVEVKRLPYYKRKALVAVDNFGNARRIMNSFKTNKEFHIKQYSVLKHSPVVRAFLMGGLTVSGVLLVWLTKSVIKK